ncbi:MAG: aminotransferase class V-fold PLP-dependent enzyme [Bacillota bacterium]|jgi:cysteine desulfurase/selenocysteine lyase
MMIFFDNAAGSHPKPQQVKIALAQSCDKYGANPGRGAYKMSLAASRLLFSTRERLARFFDCPDPNRLVFTAGATASINMALRGILKPGDHVVYSGMEHNAFWRPLMRMQEEGLITSTRIAADKWGYVKAEDFARAVRSDTGLIACLHASNVTGSVQPIERIGIIAKKNNIPFMVDTAQSAGLIPIDMQKMHISLLAFAGHKALYGPAGIGGLCIAPDVDLQPLILGGTGSNSQDWHQPVSYPDRMESGSLNMPAIAGLSGAMDFLSQIGLPEIYDYTMSLNDRFCYWVAQIEGIRLLTPPDNLKLSRVPVVSLVIDGMDVSQAAWILDNEYDIAVRGGLHCTPLAHEAINTLDTGTLRFSFGVFNTKKEIDLAVSALAKTAKGRTKK